MLKTDLAQCESEATKAKGTAADRKRLAAQTAQLIDSGAL
jgi:hypothetical protein